MKLIADSGSTKVDWRAVASDGTVVAIATEGINPVFQPHEQIVRILRENIFPVTDAEVSEVFFYGAGVIGGESVAKLERAFSEVFSAPVCHFESDVLGAARALCGNDPGIACILGTGSNTCFYDGKNIAKNVKACGFILGDEGSGAVIGKRFVADYLKGLLPEHISSEFFRRYGLDYAAVVEKVYRSPLPSRFLASFSPFINEFRDDPHVASLLKDCFTDFFKRNIWQYDYKNYKVNFVGSVAFYYSDILALAAKECGVKIGMIMKNPIEGLVEYHKQA